MAHYAKVNKSSNEVLEIKKIEDAEILIALQDDPDFDYIQTSYNIRGGVYYVEDEDGVVAPAENQAEAIGTDPGRLRKNFAVVHGLYDRDNDLFCSQQPHDSWTINTETGFWEPPHPCPVDENHYIWDEEAYQADNTAGWVQQ